MEINLFFDIITIGLGVYLAIINYNMKKTSVIHKMLLHPEEIKKVKDTKGFIDYISPKTYAFCLVVVILGMVGFISDFSLNIPYFNYIEIGIFIIMLVIYMRAFRIAREKFVM